MAAKHRLVSMEWPGAQCACGWHTVLQDPSSWGRRAGADELLDRYNAHLRGGKVGGNRRFPRDDRDDVEE